MTPPPTRHSKTGVNPIHEQSPSRTVIASPDALFARRLAARVRRRSRGATAIVAGIAEAAVSLAETPTELLVAELGAGDAETFALLTALIGGFPEVDVVAIVDANAGISASDLVEAGVADFHVRGRQESELDARLARCLRSRRSRRDNHAPYAKYKGLFDRNTNGVVFLERDALRIADVNPAFCHLLQHPAETLLGKSFLEFIDPIERDRFSEGMNICAQGGHGTLGEIPLVMETGRMLFLDVTVSFLDETKSPLIALEFKDVTEVRQIVETLAEAAQTDELTQLLNRRVFRFKLEGAVSKAQAEHVPLTLLLLDLDDFKRCNDTHGHQVGDHILALLGQIVRNNIRRGRDEGFRYGGDEFAIILVGADVDVGLRIGRRICEAFAEMETHGVSVSVGLAVHEEGLPADALLRSADQALYRAKAQGKNTVCVA